MDPPTAHADLDHGLVALLGRRYLDALEGPKVGDPCRLHADDRTLFAMDEPTVRLERWTGPWADDDPDANFKAEIALYANVDPLATVSNLAENIGVPVGAV